MAVNENDGDDDNDDDDDGMMRTSYVPLRQVVIGNQVNTPTGATSLLFSVCCDEILYLARCSRPMKASDGGEGGGREMDGG